MPSHEEPGAVAAEADAEPAPPVVTSSATDSQLAAMPPAPAKAAAPATSPPLLDVQLNIKHIQESPRAENVLELRDVTVHWYETTLDFKFEELDRALERAWLRPGTPLGVFSRIPSTDRDALHVVLGLHGERPLCTFNYEERRPVFHQVLDLIVETVAIRYHANAAGKLCFTTAGGRVRISDARLHEFHSLFLGIPRDTVAARTFEPEMLRGLLIRRFQETFDHFEAEGLSTKGFETIDRASFKSNTKFDPKAQVLHDILNDPKTQVRSFESELPVFTDALKAQVTVGFNIRASSGSVRLSFPAKVAFKPEHLKTASEQTRVFYSLVQESITSILDGDYFGRRLLALAERDLDVPLFPGYQAVSLAKALEEADARRVLFLDLDIAAPEPKWLPKLLALNTVMADANVAGHVEELGTDFVRRAPDDAAHLVFACRDKPGLTRVGDAIVGALNRERATMQYDQRRRADEAILAWAVHADADAWNVDPATGAITVRSITWQLEELEFDAVPVVLAKLIGVLHSRLVAATGDVGPDLARIAWCVEAAAGLSPYQPDLHPALQLIAAKRVPRGVAEGTRLLRVSVSDLAGLDQALLEQYSLPAWPHFQARRNAGGVLLANDGLGAAHAVAVVPVAAAGDDTAPAGVAVAAGASATMKPPSDADCLDIAFEKFGRAFRTTVPIAAAGQEQPVPVATSPLAVVSRKKLEAQRRHRDEIDKDGVVCGASPAIFALFEQIAHVNAIEGNVPVLLLGEPGVGKTHVAELIHKSSRRAKGPFRVVSAGSSGGDPGAQRSEWVGLAPKSGLSGAPPKGRRGYLMEADGGTLFIDEFAELSRELQVILLSVLTSKSVELEGGGSITPDVRVIFATNADVEALIANGKIRKDLVDRVPKEIRIPALRERKDDVVPLARRFAGERQRFTDRALLALLRHDWPRNVRGLEQSINSARVQMTQAKAAVLDSAHFDLPETVLASVRGLSDDGCKRALWELACHIARAEGFEPGKGLQSRVAAILAVSESHASEVLAELNPGSAAA